MLILKIQQFSSQYVEENLDHIYPCNTRPLDIEDKTFPKLLQNDIYKLMNTCNRHVCNSTCYKTDGNASKKLCRYGLPQPLINEIHFNKLNKIITLEKNR
jgi:hypothetical protein